MPFHAEPMFPGDLYDTTLRVAADAPVAETVPGDAPSATWNHFLAMGLQAVLVGEEDGGAGASLADIAAVAEACGRHASPAPLVSRCAVAPTLLAALAGTAADGAARSLLRDIALGEASACALLDSDGDDLRATAHGDGLRLDGMLRGADLTEPATHLLFLCRGAVAGDADGDDTLLVLAPRGAFPAATSRYLGIDGRQTVDIEAGGVTLPAASVLARGQAAREAAAQARAIGAVLACAQIVGAVGAMIEQTIDYLGTRHQFGVALATFQALRHRVVEMYVAYESARGLVRRQVLDLDGGLTPALLRDVSLLKLSLSATARQAAESTIQLHGGIGMSRELPAARLAMHALSCSLQWGDRFEHLDRLARTDRGTADAAADAGTDAILVAA